MGVSSAIFERKVGKLVFYSISKEEIENYVPSPPTTIIRVYC
jgi:hypothetical protein